MVRRLRHLAGKRRRQELRSRRAHPHTASRRSRASIGFPPTRRCCSPVLASEEPVMIAVRRSARRRAFAKFRLGDVAAVALRVHGRTLGIVIAGLGTDRRFGDAERNVLGSITRELALVLAHVDAIEEREQQAAALTAERRQLRALVEAVPVGILLVDRDERITMLSRVGRRALRPRGTRSVDRTPGARDRFTRTRAGSAPTAPRSSRGISPRRRTGPFDALRAALRQAAGARPGGLRATGEFADDGVRLGRVFVSLDVTAERESPIDSSARSGWRRSARSRVASRTTSTTSSRRSSATRACSRAGSRRHRPRALALADLEAAAEHCAELTRGLLDLARQAPVAPAGRRHGQVGARSRGAAAGVARARCALRVEVEPHLRAHADPAQLRRVLTNLALNARDAVGLARRDRDRGARRAGAIDTRISLARVPRP